MGHHRIFSLAVFTLQCFFFTLPVLATRRAQRKVQQWVHHGFKVILRECHWSDLNVLAHAINDAGDPTQAAVNAASNFKALPYNYFFKEDAETADTVLGVLRRVQKNLAGRGSLIGATCKVY